MKRDNLPDHKSVTTQSSFNYENERIDLACAFRWTVRMGMHEAIANHFSLAVNEEGSRFLSTRNSISAASKQVIFCCSIPNNHLILNILMLRM